MTETPHELVNPQALVKPRGFAHAVVPADGKTIFLAGQTGHGPDGELAGPGLLEQFDRALENVVTAMRAAGGDPAHLVSMQMFATDVPGYVALAEELGEIYRKHFGRHYPAMSLIGTTGLWDPGAKIELVCVAVIPD